MTTNYLTTTSTRTVESFPGYTIDETGVVTSLKNGRVYVMGHHLDRAGYPYVCLQEYANGAWVGPRKVPVHRLVMLAFVGPCPEGMEVRHLDGNPSNCALSNLRYGSHGRNIRDAVEHGTHFWAKKTHCPSGHPYTPENTYSPPSRPRARYCRACNSTRRSVAVA